MASSTKNVKLGVCNVYFGGQDLGLTQGGVEVTVTTETHKVEVDQFGKTAINELIMGRNVMVKVPLAETTLRNLLATMPGSTLVTDGAQASATVTFASNPSATTTVTIGGQLFSFQVATATTAYQVKIGATIGQTLLDFCEAVNRAQLQPATGGVQAFVVGGVVTLKANDPGVLGNAVTLVAAVGGTASSATLIGGVAETKARLEVTSGAGIDLLAAARSLRIHPKEKAATDFSDDFFIYQAATPGALNYAYKVDSERVYNIEFTGYPDVDSGKLFAVGNALA